MRKIECLFEIVSVTVQSLDLKPKYDNNIQNELIEKERELIPQVPRLSVMSGLFSSLQPCVQYFLLQFLDIREMHHKYRKPPELRHPSIPFL